MMYAKAIFGGLTALLGALALVVTGNETMADVSTAEWIFVAADVVGVTGVVFGVPNRLKGKHQT